MITAENILAHEIIGLDATVVKSSDPTLVGLTGKIVFETRNMISIRSGDKTRQVAKAAATTIEIQAQTGVCFISGSSLIARPEDRISRL
ncbi:MAG: ribonuclease P protein subunit [Nitrososphaera sp.]|jgi:ribonuclease P protein subunit POP4